MFTTRRSFISTATLGGLGLMGAPEGLIGVASAADFKRASGTGQGKTPWSTIEYGKISVGGELARRTQQNFKRMRHPAYLVPRIFNSITARDWPGDWVARTLFAQILLARSTSQDVPEVRETLRSMPAHMNSAGYFGEIIDPNALNEQQLGSPHGWLMRALHDYHVWTGDAAAREMLDRLIRNMALPMKDWWASYPIAVHARQPGQGGVIGNAQWRAGRWVLSSDIGNQFMVLDGLTHAWQLDRSAELKATIDAGIDRFLKMDLLSVQAQTHASLMTMRALMRMYGLTGDASLLKATEERYALYRRVAMTENYANYNWFGRPETWTEPCAVIDSFILAMQLWQFTGEAQYLEDAHLIWFNGIGRGQRATGGFGCDSCAGVQEPFMQMKLFYEAYFCCTMRGGEGHSYAIQSAYHTRPGDVAVTFYSDSKADLGLGSGRVVMQQTTQYPYDAAVKFNVISSTVSAPITLRLFAPSWLASPKLKLNGRPLASRMEQGFLVARFTPNAGDILALDGKLRTWVRPVRNPHSLRGYHLFHVGPLLLGHQGEKEIFLSNSSELQPRAPGRFQVKGKDTVLARINDLNELPLPSKDPIEMSFSEGESLLSELPTYRRQVLFRQA